MDFAAEAKDHGQIAQIFGEGGYVWHWWAVTLENWQSEFLQLLAFATLTSFLIHKGSPESRDAEDADRETLERIEKKLDNLQASLEPGRAPG